MPDRRKRGFLAWLKKNPLVARLDWQLYLLRDLFATKLWKRSRSAPTPFGFSLTAGLHPAYAMMKAGSFEPDETRLFVALLDKADVFVDIGANLGYYCCFALQRGKQVLAFEPQPQNLECLFANLRTNGWEKGFEVFPIALSSAPGLLQLFGASGPSASLVQDWAGYSPKFRQTVPVNTLDNILGGRFAGRRLIVKIDVEGAEYPVLLGAIGALGASPRPIWLVEICLDEYHPGGINPDFQRTFELFWDAGYDCYCADADATPVRPADVHRWVEARSNGLGVFNYFFVDPAIGSPADLPAPGLKREMGAAAN